MSTSSSSPRLRLAVVGLGGMGQGHIKNMKEHVPEIELTAVCDTAAAVVEKVAAEHKVPGFTSIKDLVASKTCDAVLVAVPHPLHPDLTLPCLEGGLHVLVEKPVSERISTARTMVEVAEKKGKVLAVMLNQRTTPAHAAILNAIQAGELGKITRFTLIWPDIRTQAYYNMGGWRATWRGEGGGVLINQAPHILDVLVQAVGLPKSVMAWASTREHQIEVEDFVEARVALPDGGSGFIYASTTEPRIEPSLEIVGHAGRISMVGDKVRQWKFDPMPKFLMESVEVWARCTPVEVPVTLPQGTGSHVEVMRNFARHILLGEKLLFSAKSGLGQVELSNALMLSGYTNKEVSLPLDGAAFDIFIAGMRQKYSGAKANVNDIRVTDPNTVKKKA